MFGELHARALRENAELKLRVAELESALRRLQCEIGVSVEAHDIIAKVIGTPQRPIGVDVPAPRPLTQQENAAFRRAVLATGKVVEPDAGVEGKTNG